MGTVCVKEIVVRFKKFIGIEVASVEGGQKIIQSISNFCFHERWTLNLSRSVRVKIAPTSNFSNSAEEQPGEK